MQDGPEQEYPAESDASGSGRNGTPQHMVAGRQGDFPGCTPGSGGFDPRRSPFLVGITFNVRSGDQLTRSLSSIGEETE